MIGLERGSVFAGRYEIIRSIGAGGMGAVYLACDPGDRSFKVALKILYPGTIQSNQARQRFRNEITASYRIHHPNVVRAYEYFDAEDLQAFAMEYVEGGDLLQYMRAGPLAGDEVVPWLKQIASALEAVHKAGIVHRDLKPENILVSRKGEIKISDFGVARLKGAHTLTNANSMVGTPKYLAPEYVETGECDGRGDIFAVGVIAYELIGGASPFGKDLRPNMVYDRVSMAIPPLETLAPSCPPALARIVEKAMNMQLSKRYLSARELLLDLERYERGELPNKIQDQNFAPQDLRVASGNALRDWDNPDQDHVEPLVDAPEPLALNDQAGMLPLKRTPPVWAAVFAMCLLVVATGVASLMMFRTKGPFSGLKQGIYQGYATVDGNKIPIAVWSYPSHAFVLLAKDGCAAALLLRNGAYRCQSDNFRIVVDAVGPDAASGSLYHGDSAEVQRWSVTRVPNEQGQEHNNDADVPVARKNSANYTRQEKAQPAVDSLAARPSPARGNEESVKNNSQKPSAETQKLNSIEAELRAGKVTPEDAARSLLEIHRSEIQK